MKAIRWLLLVVAALLCGIFVAASNYRLTVTHLTIKCPRLPREFSPWRIAHLSDLHSASFGPDNTRLLDAIDEAAPDVVVMTGDMLNTSDRDLAAFLRLAELLVDKYDTYFVEGNHEQSLPTDLRTSLLRQLRALGVHVLNNETVTLTKGTSSITIAGIVHPLRYYWPQPDNEFNVEAMRGLLGASPDGFTVLLAHDPAHFPTYAVWGADLTLSGHIHGGMVRLPFVGGVLSPNRTLFPRFDAGAFHEGSRTMIVSRGLGRGIGVRVGSFPELVVITLTADAR